MSEKPVFEFDRYRNGRNMAEGVVIHRATSEEEARRIALTLYHSVEDMGDLVLKHSETCDINSRLKAFPLCTCGDEATPKASK